jgi:hypothetical protein
MNHQALSLAERVTRRKIHQLKNRRIMMDEQEFLHKVSVDTNVNIELLKDLTGNEQFWSLIRTRKIIEATIFLRRILPRVGLREAKMVVEAFVKEYK